MIPIVVKERHTRLRTIRLRHNYKFISDFNAHLSTIELDILYYSNLFDNAELLQVELVHDLYEVLMRHTEECKNRIIFTLGKII